MSIVFMVFALAALAELGLYSLSAAWAVRRFIATGLLIATGFTSGAIWGWQPDVFSTLLALASVGRIVNIGRIIEGRLHESYLRHAAARSGRILLLCQLIAVLAWAAWHAADVSADAAWLVVTVVQALAAALLLIATLRHLRHTRWPAPGASFADRELPTVTVAIPARNETEDLQLCLESIVASDYPKLEVVVLDDCSQTKRTPEIIRSFAHDGVRFIQGEPPKDTWLPKNQAYDRLARESSGDIIIFCGVDVRFGPHTIRELVSVMLTRHKHMVSVLPERVSGQPGPSLMQAMRYWWELAPPRRFLNRPAVLSTCWAISREALHQAGGFASVTRAIVPEAHFARGLVGTDGYSFLRSDRILGLSSAKRVPDQHETAIRTRYPQLHRRPENVYLIGLLEAFLLAVPFVLAIAGFWVDIGLAAHLLAGLASLLLLVGYGAIVRATRLTPTWFGALLFPVVILLDLAAVNYSMWRYEFSTVEWKGRNICIPVMHVTPHLPEI